jgi:hypothetical protein
MSTQSKSYQVTDLTSLAAKVKSLGGPAIDPTQPTGEATADGVHLSWAISPALSPVVGDVITVTIISKPWVVPYSTIWSHLDSFFA